MSPSRRDLLKFALLSGATAALPMGRAAASLSERLLHQAVDSPPVPSFAVPLRIPPVLTPTRSTATTDFYDITQQIARVQILPGLGPTTMWTYNGLVPGPTIIQRQGRDVRVRQHNALQVPVSTHLHGGDVPADSDGHPLDLIPPGGSKEYFYPGLHPPAPLWYHDHAVHTTARNVYMGLAGIFTVTSDAEQRLPLPKAPFDIPLVVQDKFFLKDGSIVYPREDANRPLRQGVFGDVILVNGTPKPFLRVARRKYRFRFLNASNARVYRLALASGDPFVVVQTEGGFLPHPITTPDIVLSPSERISVVVDFSRYPVGSKVVLRNLMDEVPGDPFDPDKTREVMRFDVVADAATRARSRPTCCRSPRTSAPRRRWPPGPSSSPATAASGRSTTSRSRTTASTPSPSSTPWRSGSSSTAAAAGGTPSMSTWSSSWFWTGPDGRCSPMSGA